MRLLSLTAVGLFLLRASSANPFTTRILSSFIRLRGGSSSTALTASSDDGTDGSFLPQIPEFLRRKRTLKRLTLGNVDMYLIGTAHVSNDSCAEVDALLHCVQPHAIFVELCDSRTALLEDSNVTTTNATAVIAVSNNNVKNKTSFWQEFRNTKQSQGGSPLQALSTVLLSSVQQDYADSLGVELGGEFQCARRYWQSVSPKPFLLLGDRPLELTLVRAWESLRWWPKFKVVVGLLWSSLFTPDKEEIRKFIASVMAEDSDLLTESFKELQKQFPTLYATIIDERDSWMAAKLIQTCRALSMDRNRKFRLVAIVGAGHVPGITSKLLGEATGQTVEQVLLELCHTKRYAKDSTIQNEVIPMWVRDVCQMGG
jgi:pheromone shutdown protein TraB